MHLVRVGLGPAAREQRHRRPDAIAFGGVAVGDDDRLLAALGDAEGVIVADLDYERQDEVRAKLPALAHRRDRLFDQVHA